VGELLPAGIPLVFRWCSVALPSLVTKKRVYKMRVVWYSAADLRSMFLCRLVFRW
jgi:hypothetical protein